MILSLIGMLQTWEVSLSLREKSSHFFRFKQSPEAAENNSIVLIAIGTWLASFKNNVVSSASWVRITSLSAIEIPFRALLLM